VLKELVPLADLPNNRTRLNHAVSAAGNKEMTRRWRSENVPIAFDLNHRKGVTLFYGSTVPNQPAVKNAFRKHAVVP
jgi:hypothetical protein